MFAKIHVNPLQNSLSPIRKTVTDQVGKWLNHGVIIWKNGSNKAAPYFQNKVIAVASLVVMTLLIDQLATFVSQLSGKILPEKTEKQRTFRDLTRIVVNLFVLSAGIVMITSMSLEKAL